MNTQYLFFVEADLKHRQKPETLIVQGTQKVKPRKIKLKGRGKINCTKAIQGTDLLRIDSCQWQISARNTCEGYNRTKISISKPQEKQNYVPPQGQLNSPHLWSKSYHYHHSQQQQCSASNNALQLTMHANDLSPLMWSCPHVLKLKLL